MNVPPGSQPRLVWRPFLAGLFVSILILSLVFASRLRPASRAPVLFRPDTNIQVLLDLKYNLSAEGISCITCSGEGFQPGVPVGPALCEVQVSKLLAREVRHPGPPSLRDLSTSLTSLPQSSLVSLNNYWVPSMLVQGRPQ